MSRNSDCRLGPGVYFTQMSPDSHSMEEIFLNNWNYRISKDSDRAKMEVCIEIDDSDLDCKILTNERLVGFRDVWVYQREELMSFMDHITCIHINMTSESSWSRTLQQLLREFQAKGALMHLAYREIDEHEAPTAAKLSYAHTLPSSSGSNSSTSGGGFAFWGGLAFGAVALGGLFYAASQSNSNNTADDDDE